MTAARSDGSTCTHVQLYVQAWRASLSKTPLFPLLHGDILCGRGATANDSSGLVGCQVERRRVQLLTLPAAAVVPAHVSKDPTAYHKAQRREQEEPEPRGADERVTRQPRERLCRREPNALVAGIEQCVVRLRKSSATHMGEQAVVPPDHTHQGAHTSVNVSPRIHCFDLHSTTRHDT